MISGIFGKSGRATLGALIGGQRDTLVLADLAGGRIRASKSVLQEALTGQLRDRQGYLLRMMPGHADALTAQIEDLTGRTGEALAPFAGQVAQLDEILRAGRTSAQELIVEIGVDMTRFPPSATWCRGPSSRPRRGSRLAGPSPAPPARATRG